jgi:hypothetical protein
MTRLSALLLACSTDVHAPDLGDSLAGKPCSRVVVATVISQPGECVRLDDASGATLFRDETSEDCGGPACIRACDGDALLVLEKVAPSVGADWTERRGLPDEVPFCAHSALCDDPEVWCE